MNENEKRLNNLTKEITKELQASGCCVQCGGEVEDSHNNAFCSDKCLNQWREEGGYVD